MIDYKKIAEQLDLVFEGDISLEKQDLELKSVDWSLFKIMPDMVVYPKHVRDIQSLVRFVNEHNEKNPELKLSLTARAAGSDMSGGSLNHSIIVDVTRYMNQYVKTELGDFGTQTHRGNFSFPIIGKATAQPGMPYLAFEEKTLTRDMLMPCFPASRKLCALGGMVANNGAGEKSLKYGQNKDFVESLKVVLSDNQVYSIQKLDYQSFLGLIRQDNFLAKVARDTYELIKTNWDLIQAKKPVTLKNAAGYLIWDVISSPSIAEFEKGNGYFDLTKLFVGAQGTTGIISEITYKLIPNETKEELIVMFVDDIHDLPKIVDVLKKHDVDTIELYDDHTFKIGIQFFGDFIKDKGLWPAIKYGVRFLPEFWMAISGGVPKFIVLAESGDNSEAKLHNEILKELNDLKKEIPGLKPFIAKGKSAEKYWDFRHDSFKLLTEHSKKSRSAGSGTRTAPFIDDIAVNPEYLPEYIPRLREILDEYQHEFVYTLAGHLGDGNFHIIPLVDINKQENKDKILEISERVYTLALEYKGSITAEHNDGIVRTPYLPQMFGEEMISVFQKIKNIFDPHNIFNPGKKVGMTKDDIKKYLA